ncbi:MAG: L,D-transpeptidase family protein [Woeseiaceae bacterium]|nr:L,D-transpeptidase family protein [Woeseiaceae bacterium]
MLRLGLIALLMAGGAVNAATYELPADGSDVIGSVATVTATFEDTLVDIARKNGVGYEDIVRANPGVNVWVPGEGTEVVIPTRFVLPAGPRRGIVLNLAEYRLYYFPEAAEGETPKVMTYPISIGRMDWETPLGNTRVISKVVNPAWYPPKSVRDEHAAEGRPLPRIVPPGPNNPLGRHAMRLGLPGYLIHGTNRPAGVGMRVTHGCLRMFPEDIRYLFDYIAIDTPVRIINEPIKIGWQGDELVMEVHPILESAPAEAADDTTVDAGDETETAADVDATEVDVTDVDAETDIEIETAVEIEAAEKDPLTYVTEQFIVATDQRPGDLDWSLVEEVVRRADGMPVTVGVGDAEIIAVDADNEAVVDGVEIPAVADSEVGNDGIAGDNEVVALEDGPGGEVVASDDTAAD